MCRQKWPNEHSTGYTPPSIPGQLLVQIFIAKEEGRALGIQEMVTNSWREQNNIPGSDGFHYKRYRKGILFQPHFQTAMTQKDTN